MELPANWATDDWPPYVHSIDLNYVMQIVSPERAMEGFMAEFEAMRQAGGGLWIGIWHPFVSGRLSRWLRVEKMIDYMLGTGRSGSRRWRRLRSTSSPAARSEPMCHAWTGYPTIPVP